MGERMRRWPLGSPGADAERAHVEIGVNPGGTVHAEHERQLAEDPAGAKAESFLPCGEGNRRYSGDSHLVRSVASQLQGKAQVSDPMTATVADVTRTEDAELDGGGCRLSRLRPSSWRLPARRAVGGDPLLDFDVPGGDRVGVRGDGGPFGVGSAWRLRHDGYPETDGDRPEHGGAMDHATMYARPRGRDAAPNESPCDAKSVAWDSQATAASALALPCRPG